MGAIGFALDVAKANTSQFINLDPTVITLTPRVETFVAGTRKRVDGVPRVAQVFKLIWVDFGAGFAPIIAGGETRRFDFILVGNYDAIVEIGDHWVIGNQDNSIDYIYPPNGYEVKAGGTSQGAKPRG
jgi:hypothetical protein